MRMKGDAVASLVCKYQIPNSKTAKMEGKEQECRRSYGMRGEQAL